MVVLLPASRVVPELCSWMRWHPAWLAARHCFQKPRAHAPHPGLFAHWISSHLCSLTPFRDAWRPCRGACRAFELLGCHEGCHVFFGRPWDPRNSPPLTPPRPRHRSWPPTLGVPVWDVQLNYHSHSPVLVSPTSNRRTTATKRIVRRCAGRQRLDWCRAINQMHSIKTVSADKNVLV